MGAVRSKGKKTWSDQPEHGGTRAFRELESEKSHRMVLTDIPEMVSKSDRWQHGFESGLVEVEVEFWS